MSNGRNFRGEHDGRKTGFDWFALARERGLSYQEGLVLYGEAQRQAAAARDPERVLRSMYVALLDQIRPSRAAQPGPGKFTRVMLDEAGLTWPLPPAQTGTVALTSYLLPRGGAQPKPGATLTPPAEVLSQPERSRQPSDAVDRGVSPTSFDAYVDQLLAQDRDGAPVAGLAYGRPLKVLPPVVLRRMERCFGYSFGDVRIHPDSDKVMGREQAITEGRDVYFAPGRFEPGTERGDWLIGHELAHVVQQDPSERAAATSANQRRPERRGADTPSLEAEASSAASAVIAGRAASVQLRASYGAPQAFSGETPQTGGEETAVDGEEPRELTEEEIEQQIQEAQQQGQQRGEQTVAPEGDEAAAEQEPVAEPPAEDPGAQPADAQGPGAAGPEGQAEQPFAATPAAGGGAPFESFQALKGGALSKWDNELAWHQHFQGDSATAGIEINRDALIADALSGGALAGFQAGLKGVAIDTAINIASSRIPYLQGFVEAARILYDPQAWLEGTSQATVGNMINGGAMLWEGVTSGDPIAALDGLLTILDGINNVIGTLSSLCWIVAAASFLLSFICPAALPFAALAANWAVTLGSISTAFGVFITLGRALVIGLRLLQIKYGDADPATVMAQGERLRAQTQAFTGEFTTRAGNKLRDRAQTALQSRGQPRPAQAPATQNTATARPATRMQRVMNALNTGATVVTGGGNPRNAVQGARSSLATSRQATRAYRGTGEYATTPGGGPRSQRQRVADMEDAGATVFHNDRARERFNEQTRARGETKPAVNRELLRQQQAATERLTAASDADNEAQRRLQQAQQDADDARQRLRQAEGDEDLQARITATEAQHQADQRRVTEAEQAVATQRHVISVLEGELQRRIDTGASDIAINTYRRGVLESQIELSNREIALSNARVDAANSNLARVRARQPLVGAQNLNDQAQNNLTAAQSDAAGTSTARTDAQQGLRDANAEFNTSNRTGGMSQAQSDEARQRDTTQRQQWFFDFTGQGPTDLHGHNKGAGVTGAGGGLVESIGTAAVAEATADPTDDAGTPLGIWERTTSGEPVDLVGASGGRGPSDDYAGRLQARFDALKASLPAPPEGIQATIDGAVTAYAELDEEKRQVAFQEQAMTSLLADADASISALDAVQAISDANKEAIGGHQQQLDAKVTAQDDLRTAATESQGQAGEGAASGASTAETVGSFLPKFLEMLNIVPSRVTGGGGSGEIQQVNDSAQNQQQGAADAQAVAAHSATQADAMQRDTQASQQAANEDLSAMTGMDEQISAEQLEAVDGRAFLQQTLEDAASRQEELDAEMQRLQSEHMAAVQSGSSWAATHEQMRVAGLGELDGIVDLMESDSGEG